MMQQQPQQQQQQVIIIQQPPTVGRPVIVEEFVDYTFPRCTATFLGLLQILSALASFVGASMAWVYVAYNYLICDGFWCGAFFFPSAIALMHAGRLPTRRRIKQSIVWACIALSFASTEFGLSLDGLIINVDNPYSSSATYTCWWWYWWANTCYYNYSAMEAANGIMVAASGLQLLVCLIQITISARALNKIMPQAVSVAPVEMRSVRRQEIQQPTVTVIDASYPKPPPQQPVVVEEFVVAPSYEYNLAPPVIY